MDATGLIAAIDHAPSCPRCGYDLRGTVATWRDSCPLDGVCTECGLIVHWSEVLVPEKYEPRWCVEFADRGLRLARACLTTMLWSFLPWGFWGRVQMSHRVRFMRLAAYMVAMLTVLLLTYIVVQGMLAVYVRAGIERDIQQRMRSIPAEIAAAQQFLAAPWASPGYSNVPADDRETWVATMITAHQSYIQEFRRRALSPAGVKQSYATAATEAITRPLGERSAGRVQDPSGTWVGMYPPPSLLIPAIARVRNDRWVNQYCVDAIRTTFATTMAIGVLTALYPLTLCLLPVTLKRAKVRWQHVMRATCYSIIFPVFALVGAMIAFGAILMSAATPPERILLIPRWVGIATAVGLPAWWMCALTRYLRLPHGLAVGLLLGSISLLAVIVDWIWWMGWHI